MEQKKKDILAPKPPRKPRKTKKQKIQDLIKSASKAGLKPEEKAVLQQTVQAPDRKGAGKNPGRNITVQAMCGGKMTEYHAETRRV